MRSSDSLGGVDVQRRIGRRARRLEAWIRPLARVGYVAKGAVYLVLGAYTGRAAVSAARPDGVRGSLAHLVEQPFGQLVLGAVAFGLLAYSAWLFVRAFLDADRQGAALLGLIRRAGNALSGLTFLALAAFSAEVALRGWGSGSEQASEHLAAVLLAPPFGPWALVLAGLGAFGVAVNYFVVAFTGMFLQFLDLRGLGGRRAAALRALGQFGLLARGVVFGTLGVLLARAGWLDDPRKAGGLAEALRALGRPPLGPWVLGAVALGFVALGLYSLLQARYRRVSLRGGGREGVPSR